MNGREVRSAGREGAWVAATVLLLLAPAARAQVLIDFDDRPAPSCAFGGAERLADQWAAQGVVFSAPPGAQTSAVLDRDACGWSVSGHSPPSIAAHVAGLADLPLVMGCDPPVSSGPPLTRPAAHRRSASAVPEPRRPGSREPGRALPLPHGQGASEGGLSTPKESRPKDERLSSAVSRVRTRK